MDFRKEFERIINKIESWEHFALVRYWDWEKMLMCWESVWEWTQAYIQDKWKSEWFTLLWEDLLKTLDIVDDNYIYAIPCKCCNEWCKNWYLQRLKSKNLTFANIFINANYPLFKEWIQKTEKKFFIIANLEWAWKQYPNSNKFYWIPNDCVNFYKENKESFLENIKYLATVCNDTIFLVSAWPLANIIVYEMRKNNKNNTYIDVGSALDIWTHWRATRWFHLDNPPSYDMYARRYCVF